MFPNKFDQYFRDKLLDHSTKVSPGSWKLIHAALLRHKAFHFWKWYVAGPSAVVVLVTGHFILARINKPANARMSASVHTLAKPVTPVNPATAANDAPATGDNPSGDNPPGNNPPGKNLPAPKTNSTSVTDGTVHNPLTTAGTKLASAPTDSHLTPETNTHHPIKTGTTPKTRSTPGTYAALGPNTTPSPNSTPSPNTPPSPNTAPSTNTAHSTSTTPGTNTAPGTPTNSRRSTNALSSTGTHTHHKGRSRSETDLLASDASSTANQGAAYTRGAPRLNNSIQQPGSDQFSRATRIPDASTLTTRPTIAHFATRLAVTAKTPNPKATKDLTLPSIPYHSTGRLRLDGFGSPEYFSFKGFGFSYGAGARATIVLKKHFTITTGMQYLRVDVTARSTKDSLNQLYPGYFNNIQIPVFFGYTIGNDRVSLTANAGMIFSLYADAHGRLKTEGWPNRNGPSAYFGFNFATRVGNRMSLFAEPYLKCWYPQSTQDLPPQLFSTGVSVGLRYDLK
jgi:hypothetical protein